MRRPAALCSRGSGVFFPGFWSRSEICSRGSGALFPGIALFHPAGRADPALCARGGELSWPAGSAVAPGNRAICRDSWTASLGHFGGRGGGPRRFQRRAARLLRERRPGPGRDATALAHTQKRFFRVGVLEDGDGLYDATRVPRWGRAFGGAERPFASQHPGDQVVQQEKRLAVGEPVRNDEAV